MERKQRTLSGKTWRVRCNELWCRCDRPEREKMPWRGWRKKYGKGDRRPGHVTIAGFWLIFLSVSFRKRYAFLLDSRAQQHVFYCHRKKHQYCSLRRNRPPHIGRAWGFTRSRRTRYPISRNAISNISFFYVLSPEGFQLAGYRVQIPSTISSGSQCGRPFFWIRPKKHIQ